MQKPIYLHHINKRRKDGDGWLETFRENDGMYTVWGKLSKCCIQGRGGLITMLSDLLITSDTMIQDYPTQKRIIHKVLNNIEYIKKKRIEFHEYINAIIYHLH